MKKYPKTPTLDKMIENKDESQSIGEFIDWLQSEKEITLCYHEAGHYEYFDDKDGAQIKKMSKLEARLWRANNPEKCEWIEGYYPKRDNIEQLLADFFGVDLKKAEKEKRKVLEYTRNDKTLPFMVKQKQ